MLGIGDPAEAAHPLTAVRKRLDRSEDMRGSAPTLISRSGLYKLILRSDKPDLRAFRTR